MGMEMGTEKGKEKEQGMDKGKEKGKVRGTQEVPPRYKEEEECEGSVHLGEGGRRVDLSTAVLA